MKHERARISRREEPSNPLGWTIVALILAALLGVLCPIKAGAQTKWPAGMQPAPDKWSDEICANNWCSHPRVDSIPARGMVYDTLRGPNGCIVSAARSGRRAEAWVDSLTGSGYLRNLVVVTWVRDTVRQVDQVWLTREPRDPNRPEKGVRERGLSNGPELVRTRCSSALKGVWTSEAHHAFADLYRTR